MVRRTTVTLLGALLVAATLAGGVVVGELGGSGANSDQAPDRTITVSATGDAEADPDKVVVRVAVTHTADSATAARKAVARNVSDLRAALADVGVGDDQIRTVDYNLYRDEEKREPTRKTDEDSAVVYRASHELAVELTNVDRAGTVIDTAVDSGASRVSNVRFTLTESTRKELQREALEDAMEGAAAKAGTIAESADLALGDVRSVTTVERTVRPYRVEASAGLAAGGDTEVSAGPVTVTTSVTVTYNAST